MGEEVSGEKGVKGGGERDEGHSYILYNNSHVVRISVYRSQGLGSSTLTDTLK